MGKVKTEIIVKYSSPYIKEKSRRIPLEADTQEELFQKVSLALWKLIPNAPMNKLLIDK